MEFIQHDRSHTLYERISLKTAKQEPFGDDLNAGLLADPTFKPGAVANDAAEVLPALPSDSRGRQAGGHSARLKD